MGSKKRKKGNPSKRRTAGKSPVPNKKSGVRTSIIALLIVLIAAVGTAAGIGVWKLSSGTADNDSGNGKLSASVNFPRWVSAPGTPVGNLKAYKAAVDHYDDMAKIPCFCGCGQHSGHKSVRDCFIDSRNEDNFLFDNHATG